MDITRAFYRAGNKDRRIIRSRGWSIEYGNLELENFGDSLYPYESDSSQTIKNTNLQRSFLRLSMGTLDLYRVKAVVITNSVIVANPSCEGGRYNADRSVDSPRKDPA